MPLVRLAVYFLIFNLKFSFLHLTSQKKVFLQASFLKDMKGSFETLLVYLFDISVFTLFLWAFVLLAS